MSEGSSGSTGDDSSLGRRCLQYCVTKTDGVVKHLPRRDNLLATPPLGASAIIAVTEMSYAVNVGPFKTPFVLGT